MTGAYTAYPSVLISCGNAPSVRSKKSVKTCTTVSAFRGPTARLMISLLSGSRITWSQQLPCSASAGSSGLHRLSFFPHKGPGLVGLDLLRVEVADLLVVEAFRVLAEAFGEAQDGVETDATQAGRGAGGRSLGQMLGNGDQGVLVGEKAKQGGVGAFGEAPAAGGAGEVAEAVTTAGPAVQTQVAGAG